MAGATETAGAVLIATGGLTVLGTAMITGVMTNVAALHLRNGLDNRKHGFEYELMILAGVLAVGLCGPGDWSVDNAAGVLTRAWPAPVAIAVGVVSGLMVTSTRRVPAEPPAVPVGRTTSS
jgi:putative oxidoreductase